MWGHERGGCSKTPGPLTVRGSHFCVSSVFNMLLSHIVCVCIAVAVETLLKFQL